MPDSTIQIASTVWDGVKWLLIFLMGLLGFNMKRTIAKVDDHDKNHISRDEFNATLGAVRRENREDFKGVHDKIDEKFDGMQTTIINMLKDK